MSPPARRLGHSNTSEPTPQPTLTRRRGAGTKYKRGRTLPFPHTARTLTVESATTRRRTPPTPLDLQLPRPLPPRTQPARPIDDTPMPPGARRAHDRPAQAPDTGCAAVPRHCRHRTARGSAQPTPAATSPVRPVAARHTGRAPQASPDRADRLAPDSDHTQARRSARNSHDHTAFSFMSPTANRCACATTKLAPHLGLPPNPGDPSVGPG